MKGMIKLKRRSNGETTLTATASEKENTESEFKDGDEEREKKREKRIDSRGMNSMIITDLGNGSEVGYIPGMMSYEEAWKWFDYLDSQIPWTRPTIRVFARDCVQPRDTCYVATPGLQQLVYSGYQPHAYSWDQLPPLNHLLQAVHDALPGTHFNSVLLNRYKGGHDYVGWHSDDEKLYGPTPQIASLSFGCERDFILKRKPIKLSSGNGHASQRLKKSNNADQHSFKLKHGSLLLMRGYTQRDWIHSVPKRAKVDAVRINLTFRLVV